MTLYAVGERVILTLARGGYEAFVTDIVGGPGGSPQYFTQSPNTGDQDEGISLIAEGDIASGGGAVPTYTVGQQVTIYGKAATIIADNGDATYDTTVVWYPNQHLTLTRTHFAVAAHLIAIENGG